MQHIATSSIIKVERNTGIQPKQRLLSLYNEPPSMELTLDEFEMTSLDRLQLLRAMDVLKAKGFEEAEFNRKLSELEKRFLRNKKDGHNRLDDIQRDQVSHFILRLAYCRTEDLRRWFLTQECALLKYRLDYLSDNDREKFMHENGLDFDVVSNEDKHACKDKLMGLFGITTTTIIGMNFYKVPFIQALQLISRREVYLENGYAWVPLQRLVSIIVTRFRMNLSRALVEASNAFDFVGSDTRIGPLLKNMNKQFIGNDFSKQSQNIDKLTPDKVDAAAEQNMPLCMKNLHNNLKREHKLKHWGRLQYGLFLKGAGLDLDSAQIFWESHFTKVMSHDQYVKSYSYNIRHMYGKEGARKNYTPNSCMKIIMSAVEPGAHHGCPYKHMNDSSLAHMLTNLKIGTGGIKEIMDLAKGPQGGHFQLACQKHFDITHPDHASMDLKISDSVANHPNQWFQASVNYHKIKSGGSVSSDNALPPPQAAPASAMSATSSSFNATSPPSAAATAGGGSNKNYADSAEVMSAVSDVCLSTASSTSSSGANDNQMES